MKILSLILLLVITNFQNPEIGNYTYNSADYSESITLLENNKFKYNVSFHFSSQIVEGNYHIINDSLILDSYPQRDKMIVYESNKGKLQNLTFDVKDKMNNSPFNYHLHLILDDGKEVAYTDQWDNTKIKNLRIKGFYIVNTMGLKSSVYTLQGTHTNSFKILFDQRRIFENEHWGMKNGKIIPRGFGGELQKYFLERR